MEDGKESLWHEILSRLKEELPEASYETWLGSLEVAPSENGSIHLIAPSGFIKRGLESQYLGLIKEKAAEVSEEPLDFVIEVGGNRSGDGDTNQLGSEDLENLENSSATFAQPERESEEGGEGGDEGSSIQFGGGRTPLNNDYTFETFVQSKSNQLAAAACRAAADSPGQAYNPLFIYAKVGLGKTHLLHAIGNRIVQRASGDDDQVIYTSSERFAIEMIRAIRENKTDQFRRRYRSVQGFLLDDVQFLENKEGTQEELFHTFNELYGNNKQIVLTSDRPPDELSALQDRLISRFRWGLVADIQPPNFETRMAILRKKAIQKGIDVDDQVLELIASRVSSNVRNLEGALIKAVARADLTGGEIKLDAVRQFLPEEKAGGEELTVETVKKTVAANYSLEPEDLEGTSRKKKVARSRHIAIYLSRELTDSSFPALGEKFGDRDHSTVMHSYRKIKNMMEETPLFYEEVKELENELRSKYE